MCEQIQFKCSKKLVFTNHLGLMIIDEVPKFFGNSEISIAQEKRRM